MTPVAKYESALRLSMSLQPFYKVPVFVNEDLNKITYKEPQWELSFRPIEWSKIEIGKMLGCEAGNSHFDSYMFFIVDWSKIGKINLRRELCHHFKVQSLNDIHWWLIVQFLRNGGSMILSLRGCTGWAF